ncbi:hypothetical protein TNCV_1053841 [Trichonephila clavipes]|nr:hypothetical protein TNCV_1053841 [Trichonephila clavipes]
MMFLEEILQFRKEEKVTRTQVNKAAAEQQECSYWPRNGSPRKPPSREDTKPLQTPMPSPEFDPRLYGLAVSIPNHYTG